MGLQEATETQGMGTVVRRNAPNGEVSRPLLSFCVFVETSKKEKAPGTGALGQIQVFSLLVREVHDHGVGDDVAAFADVGIRQRDLPTSSQTGDILEVCRLGAPGIAAARAATIKRNLRNISCPFSMRLKRESGNNLPEWNQFNTYPPNAS